MEERVLYAELTPSMFAARVARAPIAYLPLGTLEWHGPQNPLGSDGIQSQGFFVRLAKAVGGVIMPMLFLGPDRSMSRDGVDYYGMDMGSPDLENRSYETQQLTGSCYWIDTDLFGHLLKTVLKQVSRAGFRIVVAHGHGPSTVYFRDHIDEYRAEFGLECFHCWGDQDGGDLGIQVDHGAANETSLVWALRPELVHMEELPSDPDEPLLAIGGRDPRVHASPELGKRALKTQQARMAGVLRDALAKLDA